MSRAATPIQQATASYFGITVQQIQAPGGIRHPEIVMARHVARYLERERGLSLPAIGELYGCDHTTALASARHVAARIAAEDSNYVGPVSAITLAVKIKFEEKIESNKTRDSAKILDALSCPTCGAPVIRELQRQIALLNERVGELSKSTGERT